MCVCILYVCVFMSRLEVGVAICLGLSSFYFVRLESSLNLEFIDSARLSTTELQGSGFTVMHSPDFLTR